MIRPIHLGIAQCGEPCRQLIQLNCLLRDLLHAGRFSDGLHLFHRIHSSHRLNPDQYTLSTALAASANLSDSLFGAQVHAHSIESNLKSFPHVANALLSLYAKCKDLNSVNKVFDEIRCPDVYSRTTLLSACVKLGQVEYALQLFNEMPQRDLPLWNAMITGCAESGYDEIAFDLFLKMHRLDIKSDNYTFASVLSLCSSDMFQFGRQLHCLVVKTGLLWRPSVVNSLLAMYFSGGSIGDGYSVFDKVGIHVGDAITYNSIIGSLVTVERYEEALCMFKDMLSVGLKPTELTFVSVMGACFCLKLANQVHGQAIKMRYGDYTSVNNAAISMYSNCRDINSAFLVFRWLGERDIVSWNAIIGSYAQENLGKDAVFLYLLMQRDRILPDEFTIGSLLMAAESEGIVDMIQAIVTKNGLISRVEVMNTLLTAFLRMAQ